MPSILIRHRVADYQTWKQGFDKFIDHRRAGGEKSYRILRHQDEPNNLWVLFEWESLDKAKDFFGSDDLKSAMQDAGVAEPPEIHFFDEAERGTV